MLAECHDILVEMYPTRHWDEPLPEGPMLDLCQADSSVQDAFVKLGLYQRKIVESSK